jgi:hypothetical protein
MVPPLAKTWREKANSTRKASMVQADCGRDEIVKTLEFRHPLWFHSEE